jgi:uncharacterized protein (TIGR02145 family)
MKRIALWLLVMTTIIGNSSGQNSITLTFTAQENGNHLPLDSIRILNLTRGGDTTLYGNDTVMTLYSSIGIPGTPENYDHIGHLRNYPNPFISQTQINFLLSRDGLVRIRVFNLLGREVAQYSGMLQSGGHLFRFTPGQDQYYLVSVETQRSREVLIMIHLGRNGGNGCSLDYIGSQGIDNQYKLNLSTLSWVPGDELRFLGYGEQNPGLPFGDVIEDDPIQNHTYTFQMLPGVPCTYYPYMTDADGNVYRSVSIGSHCWIRENLKTSRISDGNILIPIVTDPVMWTTVTTPARCWINNDSASYHAIYGPLYNWYALNFTEICPAGWQTPTHDDWSSLTSYLGGNSVAGGKLKETGTSHWTSPNSGATNESGFTALPGGSRSPTSGSFGSPGNWGTYWSATEQSATSAYSSLLGFGTTQLTTVNDNKHYGYSARCVKSLVPVAEFTTTDTLISLGDTVHFQDLSTLNPTWWKWDFGNGQSSTLQNPAYKYPASGTFTIKLVAGNKHGTDTIVKTDRVKVTYKVYDIDNNEYDALHIGTQVWLMQNLTTSRYNDGTTIPLLSANNQWINTTSGARCWYNNDSSTFGSIYGALYNKFAVNTGKLCPAGWHVPNDSEWDALRLYYGGATSGGSYKEAGTVHWDPPNWNATNESAFTSLPGGQRGEFADFLHIRQYSYMWSATTHPQWTRAYSMTYAWNTFAAYNFVDVQGASVRCIRN